MNSEKQQQNSSCNFDIIITQIYIWLGIITDRKTGINTIIEMKYNDTYEFTGPKSNLGIYRGLNENIPLTGRIWA